MGSWVCRVTRTSTIKAPSVGFTSPSMGSWVWIVTPSPPPPPLPASGASSTTCRSLTSGLTPTTCKSPAVTVGRRWDRTEQSRTEQGRTDRHRTETSATFPLVTFPPGCFPPGDLPTGYLPTGYLPLPGSGYKLSGSLPSEAHPYIQTPDRCTNSHRGIIAVRGSPIHTNSRDHCRQRLTRIYKLPIDIQTPVAASPLASTYARIRPYRDRTEINISTGRVWLSGWLWLVLWRCGWLVVWSVVVCGVVASWLVGSAAANHPNAPSARWRRHWDSAPGWH